MSGLPTHSDAAAPVVRQISPSSCAALPSSANALLVSGRPSMALMLPGQENHMALPLADNLACAVMVIYPLDLFQNRLEPSRRYP
jgi:hypothetical protein